MENRINSILELNNGEKYVVLNQAIYQDRNYYLVAKVTDDEKDVTGEVKVCEETIDDGVLKFLADTAFDKKLGARNLKRSLNDLIQQHISDLK